MIVNLDIFLLNQIILNINIMTSSEKGFKDFCISNEGLTKVLELSKESKYPGQHLMWTDDYRVELPIRLGSQGIERIQPTTIIDEWR
jgi:hypothetical protein